MFFGAQAAFFFGAVIVATIGFVTLMTLLAIWPSDAPELPGDPYDPAPAFRILPREPFDWSVSAPELTQPAGTFTLVWDDERGSTAYDVLLQSRADPQCERCNGAGRLARRDNPDEFLPCACTA